MFGRADSDCQLSMSAQRCAITDAALAVCLWNTFWGGIHEYVEYTRSAGNRLAVIAS